MIRHANSFAILFVCISSILIAYAGIPGEYEKTPKSDFGKLKEKLEKSNFRAIIGGPRNSSATITKIDSAIQQVIKGTKYKIVATIEINGGPKKCCFSVYEDLPPNDTFQVNQTIPCDTNFNIDCTVPK